MHTLIIGYGNPLRQDDGVGWYVAQHLLTQTACSPRLSDDSKTTRGTVTVIACHQLTLELAAQVSAATRVIFVDARAGGAVGKIWVEKLAPITHTTMGAFSHHVDPALLLVAAQELYGSSPRGLVVSVGGEWWGYGEQLSPAMQAVLPTLQAHVYHLAHHPETETSPNQQ